MPKSGVITQNIGRDYNYWKRIADITVTSFEEVAQVEFRFKGAAKEIIMTVEGSTRVEYSFNGNTVHGEIIPSSDRSQLIFTRRPAIGIWFKVAAGTGIVTVEAWASA